MNSLALLIPLSILLLIGAVFAFFRAVDRGQYDDLETPALTPMLDAEPPDPGRAMRDTGLLSVQSVARVPAAGAADGAAAANERAPS